MKHFNAVSIICYFLLSGLLAQSQPKKTKNSKSDYYKIMVFHFGNKAQEQSIDTYLATAFIPSLHKNKWTSIGAFKPIANDTAADKKIYLFIPGKSLESLLNIAAQINNDSTYKTAASKYLNAAFDNPPFNRYETILLKAFRLATVMNLPKLTSALNEHIYELRSYQSSTDSLYKNKVRMFNEGGEIDLFKKLNFNAIFYGDVLAGPDMPNLMYMTSFENMPDRDAHWKAFVDSPEWKLISALPEYQHNISKLESILMQATNYSDL